MPIRKQVTLQTVAAELGLTVQTVSKALKGKPGMSEATRSLIVLTAEKLGYYTKDQIRSLKLERIAPYPVERQRFLLVQTEESVSYNRLLLEGLHQRFASFGHRIESLLLPKTIRDKAMPAWLEEHGVPYADGLFIAPSIVPKTWEGPLFQLAMPRILLSFPPPGTRIDSVIWDMYEATFQTVMYLKGIGHTNIMYVGDIEVQRGFSLRWQAFCQAMQESGSEVHPAQHSIAARRSRPDWITALRELLQQVQPTAIICGIDGEVAQVYQVCRELGLRIPEDVSMVAFLNEQLEESPLPRFTRPLLPIRETGYRAADRMLWRMANPTQCFEHIRIQCDFFIGETTSVPRMK